MSEGDLSALSDRIVEYVRQQMPGITVHEISSLSRIHGGASRETYRIRLQYDEEGKRRDRGLILRRDPVGSLIETERALEFAALKAFYGGPVPVPEPLFLEDDGTWLERPFFVMSEIEGCEVGSPFGESPYLPWAEDMGRQFFEGLGHIAALDIDKTDLPGLMKVPTVETCWQKELDHWEGVIDEDELEPQPVVRAAIRHLRANPPPPAERLSVVHGDYRSGNFLYDGEGQIQGILDWEMVHIGDPYEDLAWAMNPLWAHGDSDRPAGLVATASAISHWQRTSGCRFDEAAFGWWQIFSCVKGLGIWLSSSKEYANGVNDDPVLALAGWICTSAHNKILVGMLRPEGERT